MGDILTEDLLEEMDEDITDASPDMVESNSQDPLEKKTFIKQMLGSKKNLFLVILAALFLIGTIGGVWFFFFKGPLQEDPAFNETMDTQESIQATLDKKDEIIFEDILEFEPFERISLKENSAMGLISLTLSLELMDYRYRKQMFSMQDRIRKIVKGQVGEMEWLELRGPEGKIKLKYELLKRINSIFPKVMVRNIYFTDFIMQ
jgi:flagellar FliL protein